VKANKESFEICRNNLVFNVESSKLINHSTSHVFNLPPLIGLYFKRVKSEKMVNFAIIIFFVKTIDLNK